MADRKDFTRNSVRGTYEPRKAETYRGARRNRKFGRKPKGNTKPSDRFKIWNTSSAG